MDYSRLECVDKSRQGEYRVRIGVTDRLTSTVKNETDDYISESLLASISSKFYRNMSYIFEISTKNCIIWPAAEPFYWKIQYNPDPRVGRVRI